MNKTAGTTRNNETSDIENTLHVLRDKHSHHSRLGVDKSGAHHNEDKNIILQQCTGSITGTHERE